MGVHTTLKDHSFGLVQKKKNCGSTQEHTCSSAEEERQAGVSYHSERPQLEAGTLQ